MQKDGCFLFGAVHGWERDVPLAPLTTVGAGGNAQYFARPETEEQFIALYKEAEENAFILGKGSNVVFSDKGVKVLEYNARFGDPETQAVLPRLENDLYELFNLTIDQKLNQVKLKWKGKQSICVVLASGGYPESYEKGYEISFGDIDEDCIVFHAGTVKKDGKYYTNGGRVLGVTCMGKTLAEAREKAYRNVEKISFKDMHFRSDIGVK